MAMDQYSSTQTLASIISALSASSLEWILVENCDLKIPWARFKDPFSSVSLRCGPSFTEYDSPVPLSNAAMDHLIHFPHLHTLRIRGSPPTYPTLSLPLVFPPLKELTLGEGAACGWFSLDDLKNTLEDPRFQQLRSLPRCPLAGLNFFQMPLSLDESGIETVAKAIIDIFPSLTSCEERERGWEQHTLEIAYLQQDLE